MSSYTAQVAWQRDPLEVFTDNRYSRRHQLRFDGGAELAGSSSPHVVPLPLSDASAVDPEELFVASLAACHMLWFLSIAAQRGYKVERYEDDAEGWLARNGQGHLAMTEVCLRPRVQWLGDPLPDGDLLLAPASRSACQLLHRAFGVHRCAGRTSPLKHGRALRGRPLKAGP
jgi:organic hydroperoxide reductase OsmC/OhrA